MKDPIELVRGAIHRAGITTVDYVIQGPVEVHAPPRAFQARDLEPIKHYARTCDRCPALVAERRQVVWGSGPVPAPLMFVGEAPGADEDALGVPFVGKSGQLFQRMLNEARIPRSLCRVDNCLQCRPPNNRPPKALELAACEPYLWTKIATVRPLVVCTLGKFSTNVVLRRPADTVLIGVRGRRYQLVSEVMRPILVVPTWHPAACFGERGNAKASKNKVQLTRDLRKVRALVSEQMRVHNEYLELATGAK